MALLGRLREPARRGRALRRRGLTAQGQGEAHAGEDHESKGHRYARSPTPVALSHAKTLPYLAALDSIQALVRQHASVVR